MEFPFIQKLNKFEFVKNYPMNYFQIISVKESSASFLGTKQEIKMKKAEPGAWAKLDIPKVNKIYIFYLYIFCDSHCYNFLVFHSSWEHEHQTGREYVTFLKH